MVSLHRKIPHNSTESVVVSNKFYIPDLNCSQVVITPPPPLPPPLPRPRPLPHNQSLSPLLIVMFCALMVCLSSICYLRFAKRCLRRQRNHGYTDHETHEDLVNEDHGPVIHNPIWLINTIGLDQSQIESIGFFKYKRDEKLIESTDCSVCLSEFEDDEHLRLLPKCSHAFHVPCIDTWLGSHKNCPLCRAPIIKNTNDQTEHAITESNPIESLSTSEETETSVNDSEASEDHHVVEVENNGEIAKISGILDENTVSNIHYFSSENTMRVPSDLTDHHLVQRDELVLNNHLVGSKKPCSMPKGELKLKGSSSSSSIHINRKPMKISSFGHSLRKTSSLTSMCRPQNQSY